MKYLPTILVLFVSVIFAAYQFLNYEAVEKIEMYSVLSEALVTLSALIALFIIQHIRELKRIYVFLVIGFTVLFISLLTDVVDEFLQQPDYITTVFEDLFQIVGYVLIIIGIWKWIVHNKRMTNSLQRLATTDDLTGAYNRRQFGEVIKYEIHRAIRYMDTLSLIMFDLDHFKRINDTYGHNAGDEVLKTVADRVKDNIRVTDIFARVGGEEFTILVPATGLEGAKVVADKLRQSIESHAFETVGIVTASFGVAEFSRDEKSEGLIKRSDNALYAAKANGRNRVVIAEDTLSSQENEELQFTAG